PHGSGSRRHRRRFVSSRPTSRRISFFWQYFSRDPYRDRSHQSRKQPGPRRRTHLGPGSPRTSGNHAATAESLREPRAGFRTLTIHGRFPSTPTIVVPRAGPAFCRAAPVGAQLSRFRHRPTLSALGAFAHHLLGR